MALTKAVTALFAAVSVAAGSSKASPNQTSSTLDCRTLYGGELTYKITNGASPPPVPLNLTFQVSHDGSAWYDYMTVGGDSVTGSALSGSVILDRAVMYLRAIAYGNTTNAVTVDAHVQAITAL